MEGRKQVGGGGSSSSSFTTELFGSKDSSSSPGIFGSIFAPSSKVMGREFVQNEVNQKRHDATSESWKTKSGVPDDGSKTEDGQGSQSTPGKYAGSIYQEQRVQPCHLSSSIYYGGQDVYSQPKNSQSSNSTIKKDGGEDDSGSASRGNWWQGSLYY